jgi:putative DNA primase/helicase
MFNRVADNWRPIFAIAEVAGGDWPSRCVAAYRKLISGEFEDVETSRVALLTDVQKIFAGTWPSLDEGEKPSPIERIFSKNLCERLADMKERPWPEVCKGKPITERWLARNLAAFGIRPKLLRIGDDGPARGYEAADFADTFVRYVENSPFEPLHRYNTRENEQNSSVTNEETCNGSKNHPYRGECNTVTDKKGGGGEMDESGPLDGPVIDEFGVARL